MVQLVALQGLQDLADRAVHARHQGPTWPGRARVPLLSLPRCRLPPPPEVGVELVQRGGWGPGQGYHVAVELEVPASSHKELVGQHEADSASGMGFFCG